MSEENERAARFSAYTNALYALAEMGDEEAMLYVGGSMAETARRHELIGAILDGTLTLVDRLRAEVVARRLEGK